MRCATLALPDVGGGPRNDGVAVITLDCVGESVNSLGREMIREFERILGTLEAHAAAGTVRAVVLTSAKPECFVAGADINMLAACQSAGELSSLSRTGQVLMQRIEDSRAPFIAAINGACLGGGLELALACKYRIASDNVKTQFGLPEVKLGLLPGSGGTQRLPRLVGLQAAIEIALARKNVRPQEALKLGLVDEVVASSALAARATEFARTIAAGAVTRRTQHAQPAMMLAAVLPVVFASIAEWLGISRLFTGLVCPALLCAVVHQIMGLKQALLERNPLGRWLLFWHVKRLVRKTTGTHYPAPFAVLRCLQAGYKSPALGYAAESREFGELGSGPVAKALISVFLATRQCNKNPYGKLEKPCHSIVVVGDDLSTGSSIVLMTALKAIQVFWYGTLMPTVGLLASLQSRTRFLVQKGIISAEDGDHALARVVCEVLKDETVSPGRGADLVLFTLRPGLDSLARFKNMLTATTVAEPLTALQMLYRTPVDRHPLLEIVRHPGTPDSAVAVAIDVGIRQGKTVVRANGVSYVNKLIASMICGALEDVCTRKDVSDIDRAMKAAGFSSGIFALADEVGLGAIAEAAATFPEHIQRNYADALTTMANRKMKFYVGTEANPAAVPLVRQRPPALLNAGGRVIPVAERMLLLVVNEAARALESGGIANMVEADIAAVLGAAFPPFLGGPFRYVDSQSTATICARLSQAAIKYGSHYSPAVLLSTQIKPFF